MSHDTDHRHMPICVHHPCHMTNSTNQVTAVLLPLMAK